MYTYMYVPSIQFTCLQISLLDKSHNKVRDILSEIKVFLQINHPNIVHLFGVELHHTELYIFMEYCNQGTLWSAVRQGLTERMIRIYTRDLLRAVDALHEKGIVHRDIKSELTYMHMYITCIVHGI